jgi:16S rRNA (guanine527-N7)-methyltransferase
MENIQFIKSKLNEINLELDDSKLEKLDKYAQLLAKWNKTYNLVGKSTLEEIYSRHILDSLQLVQYIKKDALKHNSILDFGAGAGMPSVMLAIVLDDVQITACERIGKKCQFLNQVRRELVLTNFTVKQEDVREISGLFDYITCRAVASIDDILELTAPVKQEQQAYILPKGINYLEEVKQANNAGFNFEYKVSESIIGEGSVVLEFNI